MALVAHQLAELRALLGDSGVLASEAALFTYEADALTLERRPPDVVVLPRSTDEVCALVRWAAAKGLPVTPRGAGTGLAGGATTEQGGLSLSLNRMDQVLRVDESRLFAWVQPCGCRSSSRGSGSTSRPIPRRSRSPPSAATSPPTPAGRTA